MSAKEGWAQPRREQRRIVTRSHYYRLGRGLCTNAPAQPDGPLDPLKAPNVDECRLCRRKLKLGHGFKSGRMPKREAQSIG